MNLIKQQLNNQTHDDNEIAIVGMSCRLPGLSGNIETVKEFEAMLLSGLSPIRAVPKERWNNDEYYDTDSSKENKLYTREGAFLEQVDFFDAEYFSLPQQAVNTMDPQQRIFLETALLALNHANIAPQTLKGGAVGVYCGVTNIEYAFLNYKHQYEFGPYTGLGMAPNSIPGRLSHFLDLNGPSLSVDTACSASLTALHLAANDLKNGKTNMAIVGGIHISLLPEQSVIFSKAKMTSPTGQCKCFDKDADGFVRGEGCVIVVLKRLTDALNDDDNILAIVKASTMNHDGRSGKGFFAPSVDSQIRLQNTLLSEANLAPGQIDYVEAHGTGTKVGDKVELESLIQVHQGQHSQDKPLIVGSVKNITGHTMAVSGLTSLLKVVMALQHDMIPANWNFKTFPDGIDTSKVPLTIPTENQQFTKKDDHPRHVMISNFGVSGTNVGIIVKEGMEKATQDDVSEEVPLCFVLSANSETSLKCLCESYIRYLEETNHPLASICYTQAQCRDHYRYRIAFRVSTKAELITCLANPDLSIQQVIASETLSQADHIDEVIRDYLKGMTINWMSVFKQNHAKVDIPHYCFDRKSYWFKKATEQRDTTVEDKASIFLSQEILNQEKVDEHWIFQNQWQKSSPDYSYTDDNQCHIWEKLPQPLIDGQTTFPIVDESSLHTLSNSSKLIYFVSSLSSGSAEQTIEALYRMIKRLDEANCQCQLVIVTLNAIGITNQDTIDLMSSSISGFVKTLYLELPHFRPILIDCDQPSLANGLALIKQELNIQSHSNYETIVAYRNLQRYISRLTGIEPTLTTQQLQIDRQGVYLITGGFGGLGLVALNYLLLKGARNIVLVSRHIRESVDEIELLASTFPEATIDRYAVDISDCDAVDQLLNDIQSRGPLKGIIHAAGVGIRKPLLTHSDEDFAQLFKGKVAGAWSLHKMTEKHQSPLDFFVVYSSISSVLGSNREAVYAAANEYLNAFVHYRRQCNLVANAICWGPWGEVGMAQDRASDDHVKSALITNEQGIRYLDFCLDHRQHDYVIISPDFLQFMLDFVPRPFTQKDQHLAKLIRDIESKKFPSDSEKPVSTKASQSPWLDKYWQLNDSEKYEACVKLITNLVNKQLSLDAKTMTDPNMGFFDLGFDSISMADLAAEIKDELNGIIETSLNITFDYPTINQLAGFIHQGLTEVAYEQTALVDEETQDVAIIGISCRFPKADDKEAFIVMLSNGEQGFSEIPSSRWDNSKYYDSTPGKPGKSYVKEMAFISDDTAFDAAFFNMSPRECIQCDPQQRIFLELAYHALEDANYTPSSVRGSKTSVYVAASKCGYMERVLFANAYPTDLDRTYLIQGVAPGLIAGRLAYFFDFKGKTEVIDSACSSAFNALQNACLSLQNQDSDLAFVGGINLIYSPETTVNYCAIKALSPDDRCNSFDAHANGYVRGEGGGILILKRLNEAIDDQDKIYAVIKGTSINSDGKSIGLLAPSGKSQIDVSLQALEKSGVDPQSVNYIEAHGAASYLGDSTELRALNEVYGKNRTNDNPYYIGSVKANIGNLEIASGVASLIKTALSLQQNKLFKQVNFNQLNPDAPQDSFIIPRQTMAWQNKHDGLNIAAINSYGFTGTNAHVVMQAYNPSSNRGEIGFHQATVLVMSAKSKAALQRLKDLYQAYLSTAEASFIDIAYHAFYGREHYPYRLAVVATSNQDAYEKLAQHQFSEAYVTSLDSIATGKLTAEEFANSWLEGKTVDFREAFNLKSSIAKNITLPLYPFEREMYDIFDHIQTSPSDLSQTELLSKQASEEDREQIFYKKNWVNIEVDSPTHNLTESIYVIGSKNEKVDSMMAGLSYSYLSPEKITSASGKHLILFFDEDLATLINKLIKVHQTPCRSFTLVTDSAFYIDSNDKINPSSASAYAVWKTFAIENLQLDTFFIDTADSPKLKQVYLNMLGGDLGEKEYALRKGIFVPRLKAINQPKRANMPTEAAQKDCYIIFAKDINLSKALVQELSGCGFKQFILIVDDEAQQATFEDLKNNIHIIQGNDGWVEQLNRMTISVDTNIRLIYTLPKEEINYIFELDENQFMTKIGNFNASIQALLKESEQIGVKSVTFLSSFCSSFGVEGHVYYAVMASLLNSYAIMYTLKGIFTQTINMGPWQDDTFSSSYTFYGKRYCFVPFPSDILRYLPNLLKEQSPNLWGIQVDWNHYLKGNTHDAWLFNYKSSQSSLQLPSLRENLAKLDPDKRFDTVVRELSDIVKAVFKLPPDFAIDEQTNLYELGLDSISAIEIKNKMQVLLGEEEFILEVDYFTSKPSLNNIAHYIVKAFLENQLSAKNSMIDLYQPFSLSYTQLDYWFAMRSGYYYNVVRQIRLNHKVCQQSLKKALNYLFQVCEMMRLEVSYKRPMQRIVPYVEHEIYYYDISDEADKDLLLTRSFNEQRNLILGVDGVGTLFIDLFKLGEETYEMHIIGTHFIFDERGLHHFSNQLLSCYQSFKNGQTPVFNESAEDFFRYVRKENQFFEKNISQKMQFWQKHNQGFGRYKLDKTKLVEDTSIPYDYLVNFPLDKQNIRAFINFHKQMGVNPTYGLIALLQIALFKLNKHEKIILNLVHTGRSSTEQDDQLGLFITHKQLNLSINNTLDFKQLVEGVEEEVLFTAPYQNLPIICKGVGTANRKLKWYERIFFPYFNHKLIRTYKDGWIVKEYLNQQAISKSKELLHSLGVVTRIFLKNTLKLPVSVSRQKPQSLVLNISSKFLVDSWENKVKDLSFTQLEHLASLNYNRGPHSTVFYFTTNDSGDYYFSIRGPMTNKTKHFIAKEIANLMREVILKQNNTALGKF